MAPACGPFGPLGVLNEKLYPEAMARAYAAAAPLARFCGQVAQHQLDAGMHFIQEQPYPSRLYDEIPWPKVLSMSEVCQVVYHRCMCKLRVQHGPYRGFYIKKPSTMTASCKELVTFVSRICDARGNTSTYQIKEH